MNYQYILEGVRAGDNVRAQLVAADAQEAIEKAQHLLKADQYKIVSAHSTQKLADGEAYYSFETDDGCAVRVLAKSEEDALARAHKVVPASTYILRTLLLDDSLTHNSKLPSFSFEVHRKDTDNTFTASADGASMTEAMNRLKQYAEGEYICVFASDFLLDTQD